MWTLIHVLAKSPKPSSMHLAEHVKGALILKDFEGLRGLVTVARHGTAVQESRMDQSVNGGGSGSSNAPLLPSVLCQSYAIIAAVISSDRTWAAAQAKCTSLPLTYPGSQNYRIILHSVRSIATSNQDKTTS